MIATEDTIATVEEPINSTDKPPIPTPPLTAQELHRILLKAYRVGNCVRKKFILALYAVYAGRLYLALGSPSIVQYAAKHFGCTASQTYGFLRVAAKVGGLPQCDAAFLEGDICWSALREIVKIANKDTEAEWVQFAKTHTLDALKDEVTDAIEKKRSRPREKSYGLPNTPVRMAFELDPEENETITTALAKVARELEQSLNGERVQAKTALLYIAERILETDPAKEAAAKRTEREDSIFTIVYARCPECRRAAVATDKGRVEVPGEVVDRVEGEANKVVITHQDEGGTPATEATAHPPDARATKPDRPNTPYISKKVRVRDGQRCSNPYCGRRLHLHAHHIEFRSEGGRTIPGNETTICSVCHSLCHHGRLFIEGNPVDGIVWRTKADGLKLAVDEEMRQSAAVPEVRVVVAAAGHEVGSPATSVSPPEAEVAAPQGSGVHTVHSATDETAVDQVVIKVLTNLGLSRKEADRRLAAARERLEQQPGTPSESDLICETLRL